MAEAREIGIRQSPLPCRYCMAVPMSSSINLATCCSVTRRLPPPFSTLLLLLATLPFPLLLVPFPFPLPSDDILATRGATAEAPPNRLMLRTLTWSCRNFT
uniref:Uncharacterized protein n=1 Tax=Arundo donax TaxID=35708 RepID=A0A0A9GXD8_ARUDO